MRRRTGYQGTASRLLSVTTATCVAGSCAFAGVAQAQPRAGIAVSGNRVTVPVAGGAAVVSTRSLAVQAQARDGQHWELSAPAVDRLGPAGPVSVHDGVATWRYPAKGWTVTASARQGRLAMTVRAAREGSMTWPVTGTDPATTEVQFPRGEGLSVPVADPWWNSPAARLTGSKLELVGGLTMPMWGSSQAPNSGHGSSYLAESDIGTALRFRSVRGRLRAETVHEFDRRERTLDYSVTFARTDGSPVAPARDYRAWLRQHGDFTSLRRKIADNPEVGKLLGALHAYTWGQARTAGGVDRLRRLGLSRMWLGYDSDGRPMSTAATNAATAAGYLVGPYDSWANAQDPQSADNPSSRWPAPVWQDGCLRDVHGGIVPGFGGRGCYLSSAAFARSEPTKHYLAQRTDRMTAHGANSYFLDVDAAGELYPDYSRRHPMNRTEDRWHRLHRMRVLSHGRRLVLGSESAGAWANAVLDYSHGSATPASEHLWSLENNKDFWGGYTPWRAPDFFFKPVHLPPDAAKAMFDPKYRVPLYETALHDSVISTDRWELSWSKLPDQAMTRALLAMLTNTPLNLVLDKSELDKHGQQIAQVQHYFEPLHRVAGTEPMTDFRWLTDDHLVQRTVFGAGKLTVTANFSQHTHDGLPPGCVDSTVHGAAGGDGTWAPRRLCPGGL